MSYTNGLDKPTDYFETKLYAGNDTGQSITMDFAPDWVWIKDRGGTDPHGSYDSVRGSLKQLRVNLTNAERTLAGSLTSFNSDGFTVGNDDGTNDIGHNFVSWNWLAGGTASSNTNGSITSTVSANTTSGFSIVSYAGTGSNATVGHGLGSVPSVIIAKDRDNTDGSNWEFYHASLGATNRVTLNNTSGSSSSSTAWVTTPTSSVFSIGTATNVNNSGNDFIAYCFAEKKGFSKFGSYVGNGSSDGSYIHLGFSPSFVIRKRTDSADSWQMHDNKRDTFNVTYHRLLADDSGSEYTSTSNQLDFLSNGFKCRASNGGANGSGGSYIYMAFAESPFVSSGGVPTTAR